MRTLNTIAYILVIIGGINWGLVGLFGLDLVAALFGEMSVASRIVYVLVGMAAVWATAALVSMRHPVTTSEHPRTP